LAIWRSRDLFGDLVRYLVILAIWTVQEAQSRNQQIDREITRSPNPIAKSPDHQIAK
jgi:hypothetical protein